MYVLYSLVLSLLFIALLPYFAYQATRNGKYAGSFRERMGWLPEALRGDGRRTLWIHAVSVGEFLAARPLIEQLKKALPNIRLVVSTTTLTGQRLARSHADLFDAALYFPFDWKFSVRRSLGRVNPSVVIILETELWPNFLRECRKRGIVTVLANGRISARSQRRYRLLGRPFKRAMADFSLVVMQSEADAERARQLGVPSDLVRVCGNLKYDSVMDGRWGGMEDGGWRMGDGKGTQDGSNSQPPPPILHSPALNPSDEIDHQFFLSRSPLLIVAGSTAPGEEEMLLAALREVRRQRGLEGARLLLAPRHPERFDEVARLIARSGFSYLRRSGLRAGTARTAHTEPPGGGLRGEARSNQERVAGDGPTEVILLDTIGELASIYRFAAVVFVGGSLVPRGGHNIIEPAAFAKPVVVGPYTENFRQVVSDFARADAIVQITNKGDHAVTSLTRELIHLLSDCEHARAIGERARAILLKNRGATDCTVAAIKSVVRSQ